MEILRDPKHEKNSPSLPRKTVKRHNSTTDEHSQCEKIKKCDSCMELQCKSYNQIDRINFLESKLTEKKIALKAAQARIKYLENSKENQKGKPTISASILNVIHTIFIVSVS